MKLIVDGRAYDLEEGMQGTSLLDLMELQAKAGLGMKGLLQAAQKMKESKDPIDFLDDYEMTRAFAGIIFLARRAAGEKTTWEEAAGTPLSAYRIEADTETPEGDAEVPTPARTASAPGSAKGKGKTETA